MSEQFKNELKNATSLKEIFDVTNKYYDTTAKIGSIAKGQLIMNLPKIITACNLKSK